MASATRGRRRGLWDRCWGAGSVEGRERRTTAVVLAVLEHPRAQRGRAPAAAQPGPAGAPHPPSARFHRPWRSYCPRGARGTAEQASNRAAAALVGHAGASRRRQGAKGGGDGSGGRRGVAVGASSGRCACVRELRADYGVPARGAQRRRASERVASSGVRRAPRSGVCAQRRRASERVASPTELTDRPRWRSAQRRRASERVAFE